MTIISSVLHNLAEGFSAGEKEEGQTAWKKEFLALPEGNALLERLKISF